MSIQPVLFPAMPSAEELTAQIQRSKVVGLLADLIDDVGETESPPGSNRSSFIDAIADEFGSPRGSPWCALLQAHVRKKNGLWYPSHDAGSCDEWVYQAKRAGKWAETPVIGAVVVYTNGRVFTTGRYAGQKDAVHVGGIVSLKRFKAIEGNTSAGAFDTNGGTCLIKPVHEAKVYGYVLP